jgi:hypothetical protein
MRPAADTNIGAIVRILIVNPPSARLLFASNPFCSKIKAGGVWDAATNKCKPKM